MFYGYHRTSTTDQHLDRGIAELEAFCKANNIKLEKIYTDQQTGKNFNRPRYQVLKEDILRSGDTLIVTELDRLGRNKQDTLKELRYFQDKGIRVMILEIPTTTQDLSKLDNSMAKMIMETINNMLIELYATMAQAEIEKKEKRQREGIETKKARGEWEDYGRPKAQKPSNWEEVIAQWESGEITAVKAMELTGTKKTTFYKLLKQQQTRTGRKPCFFSIAWNGVEWNGTARSDVLFSSATLPRGCVYPLLSSHFPRLQGLPPMPPYFEKLQNFCYNIYIRNTENHIYNDYIENERVWDFELYSWILQTTSMALFI